MSEKICSKCKEPKLLREFHKRGDGRENNVRSACKECTTKSTNDYNKKNRHKVKERTREYNKRLDVIQRRQMYNSDPKRRETMRLYSMTPEGSIMESIHNCNKYLSKYKKTPPKRPGTVPNLVEKVRALRESLADLRAGKEIKRERVIVPDGQKIHVTEEVLRKVAAAAGRDHAECWEEDRGGSTCFLVYDNGGANKLLVWIKEDVECRITKRKEFKGS